MNQLLEVRVPRDDDGTLSLRMSPDLQVWTVLERNVPDMDRVYAALSEPGREQRRQLLIDDEPQAAVGGCCACSVAYASAARMSASSRSG